MVSAYPVIAVDLFDNKLALARSLGATHTINAASANARDEIRSILGGAGADIFIDNTGNPAIIEMGYEMVKPQGRVVLVGVPRKGNTVNLYSLPLHFGKTLTGSHGGEARPESDIPRYLRLFHDGRLELRSLVTERFSLDRINDAIDGMRSGRIAGRCMIHL